MSPPAKRRLGNVNMFATATSNKLKDGERVFLDSSASMGNADIRRLGSSSYFCGKEPAKRGMHRALSVAPNRSPCRLQKQHREASNKQTTSRAELKWIHPSRLGGADSSMQSVRWKLVWCWLLLEEPSRLSPRDLPAMPSTLFSTSRNPSANLSFFPPSNMCTILSPPRAVSGSISHGLRTLKQQ